MFSFQKEADRYYKWLTQERRHLKKNCKRKPPYDWSDINEKSKDEAMVLIAQSGDAHTSYYWNLAVPSDDCPNWIARWFLYHKFRYRDGRNRNAPSQGGESSHHHSSHHSRHKHSSGGESGSQYYTNPSSSSSSYYQSGSMVSGEFSLQLPYRPSWKKFLLSPPLPPHLGHHRWINLDRQWRRTKTSHYARFRAA